MDRVITSSISGVLAQNEAYSTVEESKAGFAAAFDDMAPKLYRFAVLRVRSKERAEDFVSQAFLRAWEYMRGGGVVRSYPAFLYRTLRNLIIDEARRKTAVSLDGLICEIADERSSPDGMINAAEVSRIVRALGKLSMDQRDVLHLRFVDGLSAGDIAAISGKKRNAVYVSLFRGIKNLRKILIVNDVLASEATPSGAKRSNPVLSVREHSGLPRRDTGCRSSQ